MLRDDDYTGGLFYCTTGSLRADSTARNGRKVMHTRTGADLAIKQTSQQLHSTYLGFASVVSEPEQKPQLVPQPNGVPRSAKRLI